VLTQILKEYGEILQKIFLELENIILNDAERLLHNNIKVQNKLYKSDSRLNCECDKNTVIDLLHNNTDMTHGSYVFSILST